MPDTPVIYVVDDDEAVRNSLAFLLESAGFRVALYDSAIAFLAIVPKLRYGCVLTDVRMPGMNGLQLLRLLAEQRVTMPVIVMTGHGDVPVAVQALKAGAVDFLEKPFDDQELIATVTAAVSESRRMALTVAEQRELAARYDGLTPRERDVLAGLVAGLPNKTIGYDLGISARTVEVHRAHVMDKMRARSLPELVRLSLLIEQMKRPK